MKKLALSVLVLVLLAGCAFANENRAKGYALEEAGKYTDAMVAYKKAVAEGDGLAAVYTGRLYMSGVKGIPFDMDSAAKWYKKGIELKCPQGTAMLSLCYIGGEGGIEKNPEKGFKLFQTVEGIVSGEDKRDIIPAIATIWYSNVYGIKPNYEKARMFANKLRDAEHKKKMLNNIASLEKENTPMTATHIIDEIHSNQMRFDKSYKGKVIKVSGYAGNIEAEGKGYTLRVLGGRGSLRNPFDFIDCRFSEKQEDALLELNKDDAVTIKGTYKGKQDFQVGAAILFDCEVVK